MAGGKIPIMTITNKLYYRDDGLYIYSSADGQLDIVADTTAKIAAPTCELEASTGITLDGNTTLDTGHYFLFPNDGVAGSGSWTLGAKLQALKSGNVVGWAKAYAGDTVFGYVPIYSSNVLI